MFGCSVKTGSFDMINQCYPIWTLKFRPLFSQFLILGLVGMGVLIDSVGCLPRFIQEAEVF